MVISSKIKSNFLSWRILKHSWPLFAVTQLYGDGSSIVSTVCVISLLSSASNTSSSYSNFSHTFLAALANPILVVYIVIYAASANVTKRRHCLAVTKNSFMVSFNTDPIV